MVVARVTNSEKVALPKSLLPSYFIAITYEIHALIRPLTLDKMVK